MGALVTGPVTVEDEAGNRTTIGVHGGFIQVLNNKVTLITDRAQIAEGGKDEAAQLAEELAADAEALEELEEELAEGEAESQAE